VGDVVGGPASLVRANDATAVRIAARARIIVAVALAATGSFLPHLAGRSSALFLVVQLAWLPYATAVFMASAQPENSFVLVGGPVGDLLVLFAVQVLVPQSSDAVLLGYLVVVALGVYTVDRRLAAALAAGAIALTFVAQPLLPVSHRLGAAELIPFSGAVLALLFMLERTAAIQAQTVQRWKTKSDTILAHVADAVLVTDDAGRILEGNAAVDIVIGQPVASVIGHDCAEVLGLHRGERLLECSNGCALLELVAGADARLGCELWRKLPDDRRQPLLANASVVVGTGGRREVIHSLRDVTRIKEAEEAKTLFLATASHELKTPLTVIQGFADTLTRYPDLDGSTKAAALEAIRARSVELARIVERLLMSSRIEAGPMNLVVEEVDVAPILAERATSVGAATSRDVSYRGPSAGVRVAVNTDALITVVDHLLDNALKYSPEGQPVTLSVAEAPETVCIEVADGGIGMDAEQAAHCFDKFWQAESTDVRRFSGTGIGLYIVQSLVEGMGGSVAVSSLPGHGSTFSVHLRRHLSVATTLAVRLGEQTSIREFMRQLGVPARTKS